MPMNRALYPNNWDEISARIRARAGDKCEQCGIPNKSPRSSVYRKRRKTYTVFLTVAHLDHNPQNNSDDNLKCLCQLCHLRHDAKHHAKTAKLTRHVRRIHKRLRAGQLVLGEILP